MTLQENAIQGGYIYVNNTAYPIKKIYKGSTQVRPTVTPPPSYIDNNLVAYYPLNGDILDHKSDWGIGGTAYDLGVTFGTPSYATSFDSSKVAFNPQATTYQGANGCGLSCSSSVFQFSGDFTISFCVRIDQSQSGGDGYTGFVTNRGSGSTFQRMCMTNSSNQFIFHGSGQNTYSTPMTIGTWYNITCTVNGTQGTIYFDGSQVWTGTYTRGSGSPDVLRVGFGYVYGTNVYSECMNGCLSEIIIDGKGWTADMALQRAEDLGFA